MSLARSRNLSLCLLVLMLLCEFFGGKGLIFMGVYTMYKVTWKTIIDLLLVVGLCTRAYRTQKIYLFDLYFVKHHVWCDVP